MQVSLAESELRHQSSVTERTHPTHPTIGDRGQGRAEVGLLEQRLLGAGIIGSMPDSASDPLEVVRLGYDKLSTRYRSDDADPKEYRIWAGELLAALHPGSSVLDLGCGCGNPIARRLVQGGHQVTGIDISERQIERAHTLVPDATFLVADMTRHIFESSSFDAVVALYSLIHVPLAVQPSVIEQVSNCLVDGGILLATVGWEAWTGSDSDWLGGSVEMWWSQADQATYVAWLENAGLEVVQSTYVQDGESRHALIWARRRRRI
jgi:2-polyprenyl-3-methyl-5-hydroxy-6-metoxy-1,4-benzoquinol methylase